MKSFVYRSLVHFGLLVLSIIFVAFSTHKGTVNPVELSEAVSAGKIYATGIMNGSYSGPSVELCVMNKTPSELRIMIPAGTLFYPEESDEQVLMTTEDDILVLQPRTQNVVTLAAYCTEAGDRCPSVGGKCSIGKVSNPKLIKLIAELKKNSVSEHVLQDVIWAITDNYPISNINYLTPVEKELRSFVADLTGQKDVWYSTPQNRSVNNSGNIVSETVTITGDISYTASKGMQIHNEVVKEDGTRIHKTESKAAPFNGKVEFNFKLQVRGWEKGKYFIKVKEGERQIAEYPFSI